MNTIARLFFKMIVIVTITFSISSCKKTFDAPPGPGEVNLVANKTIAGLKSYHTIAGVYDLISQDIIICGTVIANDQSGNFYKQLFIQDSTGAIQLLLDAYSIYNSYPVGRKVYIKCNGLTLSDANSTMVLGIKAIVDGSPSMEGIPASVANQYLVGATLNNPVEPITVTLADLGSNMNSRYINALVKLNGYEFASADTSKAYGDTSSFKATVNRNVNLGCGSTINTIVRTSGYANFAAVRLPKGNGSIAAIYTIYKSLTGTTATKQLLLRDISDVKFDSTRCGGVPTPINPGGRVTIASVRAQYTGTNIKLTSSASIAGIVTSDAASKNISAGSFIIQDASGAAVTVYAGGTITYSIGDSIVLDITNDSLLNYRGSLELKTPFGFALPTPSATGRVVTPLVKTIAEINTALSTPLQSATNLDLVLVKIIGATATGGTTYSVTTPATISLADGSGSMTMFTSSTSTFGATTLPTGVHSWTGHSKMYYSTKEFVLRNTGDVQ